MFRAAKNIGRFAKNIGKSAKEFGKSANRSQVKTRQTPNTIKNLRDDNHNNFSIYNPHFTLLQIRSIQTDKSSEKSEAIKAFLRSGSDFGEQQSSKLEDPKWLVSLMLSSYYSSWGKV